MILLGIETSCDETSVAIVKDGRQILSNVIFSQISIHRKTGGVVPEVAAREHVVKILPVLKEALKKAKTTLEDIDAIAATYGPGLLSSLLIGVNAAMTLALALKKPLIPVNHVEGHIYANWLEQNVMVSPPCSALRWPNHYAFILRQAQDDELTQDDKRPPHTTYHIPHTPLFPAAVLTVSGGHNELLIWKGHGQYKFLGATLDDAAGEAFDKVARLLGLSYPGGPAIQKAAVGGNPNSYPLPRAWLTDWNFSFSGLKTAVLRLVEKENIPRKDQSKSLNSKIASPRHNIGARNDNFVADVAASFQEAVCEVLATKLVNAAKKYRVKEVHLAGGVSANQRLRELTQKLLPPKMRLRYCTNLTLCTDNAAMIAAAGYFKYKKNPAHYKKWRPIIADPNLEIKRW